MKHLAWLVFLACGVPVSAQSGFSAAWQGRADALWLGPEYWANRLQDWRLEGGRAECVRARLPMRTLHLLTWRSENLRGDLEMRVRVGRADGDGELPAAAFAGVLVGAGSSELDPRAACLVQSAPGPDGGCVFGIDGRGTLFLRQHLAAESARESETKLAGGAAVLDEVLLDLRVVPGRTFAKLTGKALSPAGDVLGEVKLDRIPNAEVLGNLALISHRGGREDRARFWFGDWRAEGRMLRARPENALGPIVAAFHTLSRGVMKMSAVMMPCVGEAGGEVRLEVQRGGNWVEVGRARFGAPDHTAVFRVADWPGDAHTAYRLLYEDAKYEGRIRKEPGPGQLRLAALTCVHQVRHGFGRAGYPWSQETLWFPHADLTARLEQQDPDLLFFAGDQIYEGASPTPPSRGADAGLDYLYKWYLFCWAFRDVARERPAAIVPDDHDVFQGNLWGAGGRKTDRDNKGGYVMPADWVRMVERTQTSHLPDPVDPRAVDQGIGVYFTSMRYGGVDFAVLEDRKFKSGPNGLVQHDGPRPDHINDPDFDTSKADVPGAQLLGERQLAFLAEWARDWDGTALKAVLSQTVFANVATHHGPRQTFLIADMDSNGWPQSGRNRAIRAIRRAFAPMICGDQHLATLVHHGVDAWRDAGWSFCVPAMANFYLRSWRPEEPGINHEEGMPEVTGDYLDGFGNMITVRATTNVDGPSGREPKALHDLNPGYGIVVFDTVAHTITFECWPRHADAKTGAQYPGWPVTIEQVDNYARRAAGRLPKIVVAGCDKPVFVVEDARGELVYALRAPHPEFRPKVFAPGTYRVTVSDGTGDPARTKVLDLAPTDDPDAVVEVRL